MQLQKDLLMQVSHSASGLAHHGASSARIAIEYFDLSSFSFGESSQKGPRKEVWSIEIGLRFAQSEGPASYVDGVDCRLERLVHMRRNGKRSRVQAKRTLSFARELEELLVYSIMNRVVLRSCREEVKLGHAGSRKDVAFALAFRRQADSATRYLDMPTYEVEHVCPLTEKQQDALASAITDCHATLFGAPKFFVNVRITDISTHRTYVAGKRVRPGMSLVRTSISQPVSPHFLQSSTNRIFAYVRGGPSRTQKHYDELCSSLIAAWDKIVPGQELRLITIHDSIKAGYEAGFSRPQAGEDKAWIQENMQAFQQKADTGDADFQAMIQDIKDRNLG